VGSEFDPQIPSNTVAYFFREAFRRIWISKRTSFVAVAMIAVSMLIVGFFLLLSENLGRAAEQAQGKSRVDIYLSAEATPAQVAAVDRYLAAHRDLARRRFVSSDEALRRFTSYFANLNGIVAQLDANPFPASFECDVAPQLMQSPAFGREMKELRAIGGVDAW